MSRLDLVFKNEDETGAIPIDADNLNEMVGAINGIVAIDSTTEEHNEEIVLIKGKNLYKASDFELGNINQSTGEDIEDSITIRTKNYIKVQPNDFYTVSVSVTSKIFILFYFYKKDNTFMGSMPSNNNIVDSRQSGVVKIPNNCEYMRIVIANTSSVTATNIQIEKGVVATPYEEPKKTEIYANNEKYTDTLNIGTEPNNSGLWVEHSKNLLKINDFTNTSNGLTLTAKNGKITITGTATGTYFSLNLNSNINLAELQALTLGTMLTFSVLDIEGILAKQVFIHTDGHDYYYQPDSTTKYVTKSLISKITNMQIYFATTVGTEYNITFSPMLELGNTAHNFDLYVTPSILVNNNGIYETIANKNVYSTSEVIIGEYMGKPLYRKVFTGKMGTCTTDGTYGTANNIVIASNIETLVNATVSMKIGGQVYHLPYINNSGMIAKFLYDGGNGVQLTTNGTSFSQQNCTIIAEYTKTTDTTSAVSTLSEE